MYIYIYIYINIYYVRQRSVRVRSYNLVGVLPRFRVQDLERFDLGVSG